MHYLDLHIVRYSGFLEPIPWDNCAVDLHDHKREHIAHPLQKPGNGLTLHELDLPSVHLDSYFSTPSSSSSTVFAW